MSLESCISELTAELRALRELLTADAAGRKSAATARDEKPVAPAAVAEVSTPPPATPPVQPPAGAAPREQATKLILAVQQQKGRDAALAVLQAVGAKKLPEVPDDKIADVIAAAQKALA